MLENQTPVCSGGLGEQDWETVESPHNIKTDRGLPSGNAGTFQLVGDVAARIVRDLGRRIGAEYVP
jgi:hypothetical protein